MSKKPIEQKRMVALNRRARYDYFILETLEAGIVLSGSEVKSLRCNNTSITESHAYEEGGEVFLMNVHIPEYGKASHFSHYPKRPRKLLLHKREIKKIIGLLKTKGITLVPLSIYFNRKNLAKVELAVVKGKKEYDKRETIKAEEWKRQKARLMKGNLD